MYFCLYINVHIEMDEQTDGETKIRMDGQTDQQTDRWTDGQTIQTL